MTWLKRYWPVLFVVVYCAAVLDVTLSSLATCHPPPQGSAEAIKTQYSQSCSYLHGPILIAFDWIVGFIDDHDGFFVVLFTAGLVAFTAALWRSTDNLVEAGERQIAIAQQMADVSEKQLAITALQTDIQKKQHAIGRLQFLADKRPRLRIRHVTLYPIPGSEDDLIKRFFDKNEPLKGSLVVVNTGGTDAKFIWSRYRFYFSNFDLPMDPPIFDETCPSIHAPAEVTLAGGQSCTFQIECAHLAGDLAFNIREGVGGWRAYIMGYIKYSDPVGIERFVGFCRIYQRPSDDGGDGRFVPIDNPDYEYED